MIQYHKENILAHVADDNSLSSKVSSVKGCITVISLGVANVKACYSLSGDNINLSVKLDTPLGDINLGSATIDPANPKVTLKGGVDGFKAEVTISFDFSTYELKLCGKVCAPFAGCASGCTSIHL